MKNSRCSHVSIPHKKKQGSSLITNFLRAVEKGGSGRAHSSFTLKWLYKNTCSTPCNNCLSGGLQVPNLYKLYTCNSSENLHLKITVDSATSAIHS
jgi:hypothetical protein